MSSLLARGMGHCGAVAVCLLLAACSLQNFDGLSSDGAGSGGASGALPNLGGSGGDGGGAPGGRGGAGPGPVGGSGGRGGTGGAQTGGGAAGVGNPGGSGGTNSAGSGGSSGSGGGSLSGDGGTALNLLPDPSFTLGHAGWTNFGSPTLEDAPGEGRDGTQCLVARSRTQTFEGPAVNLETLVVGGQVYTAEAWVRTSATTTQTVSISIKTTCTGVADVYTQLVTELVASGEWLFLSGEFTATTCALDEYTLYIEGPESGVDLYVDDVGLYRVQ